MGEVEGLGGAGLAVDLDTDEGAVVLVGLDVGDDVGEEL